jgi:hypothetical protein
VRVIKNWEASGLGEGAVPRAIGGEDTVLKVDDIGFGGLQGRAPHALSNRHLFGWCSFHDLVYAGAF